MGRTRTLWALRGLVVLGGWTVAAVTFLDPRWGAAAAAAVAVFITAACLWLARVSGPMHQCPGRHEARHRLLREQRALLVQVAANAERLAVHEEQLGGYEKAWAFLADLAPGQWDARRRRDLHLVRDVGGGEDELGQRAGLLSAG